MVKISEHALRHEEDLMRHMEKRNCGVDPLDENILANVVERGGVPQRPSAIRGERGRWRAVAHFCRCAKVRYVFARLEGGEVVLVTTHPDPDAKSYLNLG